MMKLTTTSKLAHIIIQWYLIVIVLLLPCNEVESTSSPILGSNSAITNSGKSSVNGGKNITKFFNANGNNSGSISLRDTQDIGNDGSGAAPTPPTSACLSPTVPGLTPGNAAANYRPACSAITTTKTVTIIRISPELLQTQPYSPFSFYVDSTIPRLTIDINGSDPMDTSIFDPSGHILNDRFKRAIRNKSRNRQLNGSQLQLDNNNPHKRQRRHANSKQNRHRKSPYPEIKSLSSILMQFAHENNSADKDNIQQIDTSPEHERRSFHGYHVEFQSLHSKFFWRRKQNPLRKRDTSNMSQQLPWLRKSYRHHGQGVNQQHHPRYPTPFWPLNGHTSNLPNTPNSQEEVYLINKATLPDPSPGTQRAPNDVHDMAREYNGNGLGVVPDPNYNSVVPYRRQKHFNSLHSHTVRPTNRKRSLTTDDLTQRKLHKRLPNRTERNDAFKSAEGIQSHSGYLLQLQQKTVRKRLRNVKRRQRRDATLRSLEMLGDLAIFEVEPPQPGLWTGTVTGALPKLVRVTAPSIIDFSFEFLDIRTLTGIDSQPVARDTGSQTDDHIVNCPWYVSFSYGGSQLPFSVVPRPLEPLSLCVDDYTLARIYLEGLECMANVSHLGLQNDAGRTFKTVDIKNVELTCGPNSGGIRNSLVVPFTMPDIPFYMTLSGQDVLGGHIQRVCERRVVPRMFVISMVEYRGDPLVPGGDNRFGVRLRNKGRADMFSVTASFDSQTYLTARTVPSVVHVSQDEISHITVLVDVLPSIHFLMDRTLIVKATRMSDNITETMTEDVKAMPTSFMKDYEAPNCVLVSQSPGCSPHMPCTAQSWNITVDIVDRMTGVKSAAFSNPPQGAFTSVNFRYAMINRTAQALYRSNCCTPEASIHVEDFVSNADTCRFIPPALTTTWTQAPSVVGTHTSTTRQPASGIPFSVPGKISTKISTVLSSRPNTPSTFAIRASMTSATMPKRTSISSQSTLAVSSAERTVEMTSTPKVPSTDVANRTGQGRLTFTTGTFVDIATNKSSVNKSSVSNINTKLKTKPTSEDEKFTALRLAAIICGSIAGAAGIAIMAICVVYAVIRKRTRGRPHRQDSSGSDVTMGSSWETRSEGSSGTDSLRMHRAPEGRDTWSSDLDGSRALSQHEDSSFAQRHRNENTQQLLHHARPNTQTGSQYNNATSTGLAHRQWGDRRYVNFRPRRRDEDVEDVTFRCVVVKDDDEDEDGNKVTSGKVEAGGSGGEHSYSPLLNLGGKMYTSMLEVQRKMEELERRIREQTEDSDTQTEQHVFEDTNRQGIGSGPTRYVPVRHRAYDDTPPGSPRTDSGYYEAGSTSSQSLNVSSDTSSHSGETSERPCELCGSQECPQTHQRECSEQASGATRRRIAPVGVQSHRHSLSTLHTGVQNKTQQRAHTFYTKVAGPQIKGVGKSECNIGGAGGKNDGSSLAQQQMIYESSTINADRGVSRNLPVGQPVHYYGTTDPARAPPALSGDTENTSVVGDRRRIIQAKRMARVPTGTAQPAHSKEGGATAAQNTPPELRRHVLEHNLQAQRRSSSPHAGSTVTVATETSNQEGASVAAVQRSSFRIRPDYLTRKPLTTRGSRPQDATRDHEIREGAPNITSPDHSAAFSTSEQRQTSAHGLRSPPGPVDLQHPEVTPVVLSQAGQLALRQDIRHIRDKLLQFQRRIDDEIEAEEQRSRSHSACSSGNHSNTEEEEDRL